MDLALEARNDTKIQEKEMRMVAAADSLKVVLRGGRKWRKLT